ncbi:MAG: iron-containing alcohol dehydrogenase [Polyangia bacterium]
MSCAHYFAQAQGGDGCFAVDASNIVFGRGALLEAGKSWQKSLGLRRVALFTDPVVRKLPPVQLVTQSLRAAGIDSVCYDEVRIEPSQASFEQASQFYAEGRFDGQFHRRRDPGHGYRQSGADVCNPQGSVSAVCQSPDR